MRKPSYLLRFALTVALAVSALAPAARLAAQESSPVVGAEQTPIDIRDEDLTFVEDLAPLGFSYGTKVTLDVHNNGSPDEHATVKAEVPEGAGKLIIADVSYGLLQFHWHAPSEHERNGQKFPMEMHLVHQAGDGTLSVVGVFVVAGKEHKELKKLFAELPQQEGEHREVKQFNLTRLLPEGLESFRYQGSLTTPEFDEGVRWVVLAEPIEMSAEQIAAFQALFPGGNSRELQPLNGRTILTDVVTGTE